MRRWRVIWVGILLAACGSQAAMGAVPYAGPYSGRMSVPYAFGEEWWQDPRGVRGKTQPLEFTVRGAGDRILAFDVPLCTSWRGRVAYRANRAVRPSVSRSGVVRGHLEYSRVYGGVTLEWTVKVKGRFVTRKYVKGTVFVAAKARQGPSVVQTCRGKGPWSASSDVWY